MKIIKIKPAPCNCNAYAFPHRANSGACNDPGEEPKNCQECKFYTRAKGYSDYECEFGGCLWGK